MQLSGLNFVLWVAGFFGHLALLVVLITRRRAPDFPFFTCLILSNVFRTVVLYFTLKYGTKQEYFYFYWSLAVIDVTLQFCVVYEMASKVFRPIGSWAPDARGKLISIGGISIVAGLLLTALATPAAQIWIKAIVVKGNFFSSVLMSELFVGMLVLSAKIGLPWKTHVARISQGLGLYSLIGVFTEAGHSIFGIESRIAPIFSEVRMIAYLCCLGYWIVMLWRTAPEPRQLSDDMRSNLYALQEHTEYDLSKLRAWRKQ